MNKQTWSIVGSGWISTEMIRSLSQSGIPIRGIYSTNLQSAKELARKFGIPNCFESYDLLLEDPGTDIVYIGSPNQAHYEQILQALDAGKNVFCEKPMVFNERQFTECLDKAKEKDRILMDGTTLLHMPLYQKLQTLIESGMIGDLNMIQVSYGIDKPETERSRFYSLKLGGGALMDIGLYCVSFMLFFMDSVPGHIQTFVQKSRSGADSLSVSIFQNKEGQLGEISLALQTQMPEKAILCGSKGFFEIERFARGDIAYFDNGHGTRTRIEHGDHNEALHYEIEIMSKAVADHQQPPCMDTARDVIALLGEIRQKWNLEFPGEHRVSDRVSGSDSQKEAEAALDPGTLNW